MAILVRSSERLTCRISLLFDRGGRRTGSASYDLPLSIPGKLRMLCNTKPMLLANTFPPIPCPSLFTGEGFAVGVNFTRLPTITKPHYCAKYYRAKRKLERICQTFTSAENGARLHVDHHLLNKP